MRAVYRVVLVCVLAGLLGTASVAVAAPVSPDTVQVVVAQQPPGPNIQPDTAQSDTTSKNKLVIGIAAVVLLGIVILGRRARNKRKKKASGG